MVASAYAQMHDNDKINDIDLKALGLDDVVNVSTTDQSCYLQLDNDDLSVT